MTEQWLIQDIKKLLQLRNRFVLLDPTGQCGFVLPILKQNQFNILQTDNTISEKWQQEKLSFLFDYSFTHGCFDLSNPQNWLKKKIFTHTGL